MLQFCNLLGSMLGIIGGQGVRIVLLLKIGGAKIMPKRKSVKDLDTEIERLKRQVEIADLKKKLADKSKRR